MPVHGEHCIARTGMSPLAYAVRPGRSEAILGDLQALTERADVRRVRSAVEKPAAIHSAQDVWWIDDDHEDGGLQKGGAAVDVDGTPDSIMVIGTLLSPLDAFALSSRHFKLEDQRDLDITNALEQTHLDTTNCAANVTKVDDNWAWLVALPTAHMLSSVPMPPSLPIPPPANHMGHMTVDNERSLEAMGHVLERHHGSDDQVSHTALRSVHPRPLDWHSRTMPTQGRRQAVQLGTNSPTSLESALEAAIKALRDEQLNVPIPLAHHRLQHDHEHDSI